MTSIKTISLACRVVLDMHALNNEGNESNRLMTRQVGIVRPALDEDGAAAYRRDVVNAISGDMNKHIFADAFRNVALDLGLPLNRFSQALDPARIMADPAFLAYVEGDGKNKPEADQVIDALLTCSLTDVCGIMITAGGQSIKRKSAVEFGWTIGIPEITQVEEFIHARHAITRLTRTKVNAESTKEEREQAAAERGANTGQMIFNRPASSGVYAFVAHVDVGAIGFNDATQQYPHQVGDVAIDRAARLRATLLALAQTVLHPKGALTSTQFPHVVDVEGFVSTSESAAAAPLISPLNDDYIARAGRTAELLNRLHGSDSVHVKSFAGGEGLLEQMADILDRYEPGRYTRYA
jgi:CRISPR-associated protein Cst2